MGVLTCSSSMTDKDVRELQAQSDKEKIDAILTLLHKNKKSRRTRSRISKSRHS
jgi:hypothetical protein